VTATPDEVEEIRTLSKKAHSPEGLTDAERQRLKELLRKTRHVDEIGDVD
jgi:hypothetical protein